MTDVKHNSSRCAIGDQRRIVGIPHVIVRHTLWVPSGKENPQHTLPNANSRPRQLLDPDGQMSVPKCPQVAKFELHSTQRTPAHLQTQISICQAKHDGIDTIQTPGCRSKRGMKLPKTGFGCHTHPIATATRNRSPIPWSEWPLFPNYTNTKTATITSSFLPSELPSRVAVFCFGGGLGIFHLSKSQKTYNHIHPSFSLISLSPSIAATRSDVASPLLACLANFADGERHLVG